MQLIRLALKNIQGSGFRNTAIFLCVMGIAGFLLSTTLIIQGFQGSLEAGINRLGADIIVVPLGTENRVESALLMGKPTSVWMPEENLGKIEAIPGVEKVSAQLYLASLYGAACCSVSEMFMVVYDPKTDFTITPWLQRNLHRELIKGEVIGGSYIFVPPGEQGIFLYGYLSKLRGNLEATGTGIDQTLFMPWETAQDMAESSITTALEPLEIPPNSISAVMVKTQERVNPHEVATRIMQNTTGMYAIESPDLFKSYRNQMNNLLWVFFGLTVVIWILAGIMIGVNLSMSANARRREMAVLRSVGAAPSFVFRLLLTEASLLATGGAILGISLAALVLYVFRNAITASLKLPFLFPSALSFAGIFAVGVALAICVVALSAFLPAIRASRQELAMAMRE